MDALTAMHLLLREYRWQPKYEAVGDRWLWRRRGQRTQFETYKAGPGFAMRCCAFDLKLRPTRWGHRPLRMFRSACSLERYLKRPRLLEKELAAQQAA